MNTIRKTAIAGSWYPGKTSLLRKDIESYFASVPDLRLDGEIISLIAPHAGYVYSGQVAAHAYNLVRGEKVDVVIVIGPSHRMAFHGVSIFSKGGYETPLGVVPIAEEVANNIKGFSRKVEEIPAAHLQEHSLEIQLPFLQVALGDFSFVPLVMGDQNESTCRDLSAAIHQAVGNKKVLIVGSSDLSHFHNYSMATRMDAIALNHLQKCDANGLLEDIDQGICEACGGGPMAVAMMAAAMLGALKARILRYANSGDITGEKSSVVGYGAAVYYK
jgi:MEMO1 family protein